MATAGEDLARELQAALVPLTSVTAGFSDLTAQIRPFVEAFSPGEVWLFKDALLNLQATIGQALLPILEQLTESFGEASGVLGPAMRELAPVVQKAAEVMTALFIPNLQLMAATIDFLLPLLEVAVEFFRVFNDVLRVATTAVTALAEALKASGLGTLLATIGKGFIDVIKEVMKALVLLAATLVKFFGGDELIKNVIKKLTEEPQKEVNRAPQNAAIKGFEQISHDIVNAAFIANKGAPGKTQDDFLKELVDGLKDVNAGRQTVEGIINAAAGAIVGSVGNVAGNVVDGVGKLIDKFKEWLATKLNVNPFG